MKKMTQLQEEQVKIYYLCTMFVPFTKSKKKTAYYWQAEIRIQMLSNVINSFIPSLASSLTLKGIY